MKFVVISDTHGIHQQLNLPDADVIIHAGDVSNLGKKEEILFFLDWFSSLPYQHRIFIAGNHDFFFERNSPADIFNIIPAGITYLNDTGINIEGIEIWGSPITPWFNNWAFNRMRGADIRTHWSQIPDNVNVLITHGPPFRCLDFTIDKKNAGCKDLFNRIEEVNPSYHIFGHVHEGYGTMKRKDTTFINASILDESYKMKNKPVIFEL